MLLEASPTPPVTALKRLGPKAVAATPEQEHDSEQDGENRRLSFNQCLAEGDDQVAAEPAGVPALSGSPQL